MRASTNAHALARYAALSQEAGIVPIVEPEVLMDADNTIERCREVTARTLQVVFAELERRASSSGDAAQAEHGDRGQEVPDAGAARPGRRAHDRLLPPPRARHGARDRFLSGGQSEVEATENLDAINRLGGPVAALVSYGRALQASALEAWGGNPANVEAAQAAFLHRARMNALAAAGDWSAEIEEAVPA